VNGTIELTPFDCWGLVEREGVVARVVWSEPDGPAIAPVNYVVADGAVWFQTSAGSRLAQHCDDRAVLVEVDSVDTDARQGWSVIVTGTARQVEAGQVPELLGRLDIWPPGPHPVFVRVEAEAITGRRVRGLGS